MINLGRTGVAKKLECRMPKPECRIKFETTKESMRFRVFRNSNFVIDSDFVIRISKSPGVPTKPAGSVFYLSPTESI